MFGISFTEIIIIFFIAFILFGPKKIPEIARKIGKWLRELRKITDQIKDEINKDIDKI